MQKLGSLHLEVLRSKCAGAFALYLFSMSAYSVSKAALTTDYFILKGNNNNCFMKMCCISVVYINY